RARGRRRRRAATACGHPRRAGDPGRCGPDLLPSARADDHAGRPAAVGAHAGGRRPAVAGLVQTKPPPRGRRDLRPAGPAAGPAGHGLGAATDAAASARVLPRHRAQPMSRLRLSPPAALACLALSAARVSAQTLPLPAPPQLPELTPPRPWEYTLGAGIGWDSNI